MKRFFYLVFATGSSIAVLSYLLACFTPYIRPQSFWPMPFLALGFPYIALFIVFLMLCWFFIKRKVALLFLLLIIIGSKNIFSTIGLHPFSKQTNEKKIGCLRIMTWNVRGFDNPSEFSDSPHSVRQQMFQYIKQTDPDVICMQEFAEHKAKSLISTTTELLDLGYNYFYRTDEIYFRQHWGIIKSGTAIFSKIPITNYGKQMYNDPSMPENIAYIDVKMGNKPLRIFATHFKSLNLKAVLVDSSSRARYHYDSTFIYTASKFEKLKTFPKDHAIESEMAKAYMDKSPFPYIFCGDLNSVPTSYPYHVMANGLQDAFLQHGFGLGTTMDSLPATLRIDFLLVDKRIAIKNYVKNEIHLSDHFPQFIDVEWKE